MINAEGVADAIDFDYIPFGNNYFATAACGGAPYNSTVRHCWSKACYDAAAPAPDCFKGTIVTQHGDMELQVNRIEACAKHLTPSWRAFFPYLRCMEAAYPRSGVNASDGCAKTSRVNADALNACAGGADGVAYLALEARATPDHPGTPTVLVDGTQVEAADLLSTVCKALKEAGGMSPKGCDGRN